MFFASVPVYAWLTALAVLVGLILANEFARYNKWTGLVVYLLIPIILSIFVWPHTSGADSGAPTANWFQWAKVYSSLAGCLIFMALRFSEKLQAKKFIYLLIPGILAINILEACIREFQVMGLDPQIIDGMFYVGGGWNGFNAVAGLLNIVTLCGWFGIIVSKDKQHDMIWPDMTWMWIVAYDLWNFAYLYNVVTDRAVYGGLVILTAATLPAFLIKKGAWLQHRASTLAMWMMIVMTFPNFFTTGPVGIPSTHNTNLYWIVSIVAFAANFALFVYEMYTIRTKKRNPIKGEVYQELKSVQNIYSDNINPDGVTCPADLAYPEMVAVKMGKK